MRHAILSLAAAALLTACGGAVRPDATPSEPLQFEGDSYLPAGHDSAGTRIAEVFLRAGDPAERFARRITIAELDGASGARGVARGVLQLAKLRSPGLKTESFAAEGREEHDVTVSFILLTDDQQAIEVHVVRFVDLIAPRVREYHFVMRRYTNGADPDAVLAEMLPEIDAALPRWVARLNQFDRAPRP
jgi:hypothetical protein